MDDTEENMSSEDMKTVDSPSAVKKPKKRSLVERELETNLTSRITSPVLTEGLSTSRYGRARRLKTEYELKNELKSPKTEITPVKEQPQAYKMHASNSPSKKGKPKQYLDNQIDNIYQENISLSRFSNEKTSPPAKKFSKVYIRKDLIQNREEEETIMLIKNLFSPSKSSKTPNNKNGNSSFSSIDLSSEKKSKISTPSITTIKLSSEKKSAKQNGHVDNTSVVKTLDFDGKKKKETDKAIPIVPKNELFDFEAKCPYQVGDLAWARMGTFPFWPCIVTREPSIDMFVKKKMFGRVEREIIHVTFLGDNGRRSWIVDNMLQAYQGLQHFEETRTKFTAEDKKKDPKLYAAYFVSEKKQALWNNSVEEAETLFREPKRLRIDLFNDMLWKSRASKKPKSGKISRTGSDVSLSESLYDSLFSEDDKSDDPEKSKSKTRNKSFDVSEVVTACLDNMAAKTGITKIQRQSHMDRWLQKAKSKTPEKISKLQAVPIKLDKSSTKSKIKDPSNAPSKKSYMLRKSNDSQSPQLNSKSGVSKDIKNDINKTKAKKVKSKNSDVQEPPPTNGQYDYTIVIDDSSNSCMEEKEDQQDNKGEEDEESVVTDEVKLNISQTDMKVADVETKNEQIDDTIEKMDQDLSINDETSKNSDCIDSKVDSIKELECSDKIDNEKEGDSLERNKYQNYDAKSNQNDTEMPSNITTDKHSMEVDETSEEKTANDEASKTVSKESVDAIVKLPETSMKVEENGMKDLNGVTNETSVTEKKNDGTINIQADNTEEDQGVSNKNKTYDNIPFLELDNSNSSYNSIAEKPKCKQKNADNNDKSNETNKIENKLKKNDSKLIEECLKFNECKNSDSCDKPKEKKIFSDVVDINLKQNNSGNFELILHEENDKDDSHTTLGSDKSLSALENSQMSIDQDDTKLETLNKTDDNINKTEEENRSSIRSYVESPTFTQYLDVNETEQGSDTNTKTVISDNIDKSSSDLEVRALSESPTFTQLLESEEFFRDVNEECDKNKSQNLSSDVIEKLINEPEVSKNIENKARTHENLNEKDDGEEDEKCTKKYFETDSIKHLNKSYSYEAGSNVENNLQADYKNDKLKNIVNNATESPTTLSTTNGNVEKSQNGDNQSNNKVEVQNYEGDDDEEDEESEDEPSPEYESLDEDITEDFRKHLQSIESNIKDKKDEEQIVKICNEIAEKAKLSPTKYVDLTRDTKPNDSKLTELKKSSLSKDLIISKEKELIKIVENGDVETKCSEIINTQDLEIKREEVNKFDKNEDFKENSRNVSLNDRNSINVIEKVQLSPTITTLSKEATRNKDVTEKHEGNTMKINGNATEKEIFNDLKKSKPSLSLTKNRSPDKKESKQRKREPKIVISPLKMDPKLKITNKSIMDQKSCKKRLSLKRDSPKSETKSLGKVRSENEIDENDLYIKPIKEELSAENSAQKLTEEKSITEKNVPEPIIVNGYHKIERNFTNDQDFDTISINSEDSEDSVPAVPRRNLRSRPERTLEFALKSPEFLSYLELRQDSLMDEHPDLNDKEILSYVFKTWQYEEDSKSDIRKIEDTHNSSLIKGLRQDTPSRKKSKKSEPKHTIESYFRDKYEHCSKTIDFDSKDNVPIVSIEDVKQHTSILTNSPIENSKDNVCSQDNDIKHKRESINQEDSKRKSKDRSHKKSKSGNLNIDSKNQQDIINNVDNNDEKDVILIESADKICSEEKAKNSRRKSPVSVDLTDNDDVVLVKDKYKDLETVSIKSEESRKSLRSRTGTPKILDNSIRLKEEFDTESVDSDNSEINLRQLRSKVLREKTNENKNNTEVIKHIKDEVDDNASNISDNEPLLRKKKKVDKTIAKSIEDPDFIKYVELRQDAIMDENPHLSENDIVSYLHKTWLYEESSKSEIKKNDEIEQANLVKGLGNDSPHNITPRKKKRPKVDKTTTDAALKPKTENLEDTVSRDKPRRKIVQPLYNEEFYSDVEDELEVFEIFKHKKTPITVVSKAQEKSPKSASKDIEIEIKPEVQSEPKDQQAIIDEIELYFTELAKPKPSVFKGLIRERVCDICEREGSLIKCKCCHGMFHLDCVNNIQPEIIDVDSLPSRGRKKKRKSNFLRKPKSLDSEHSDEKSQDVSMESVEEIVPPEITFDAETFESQLEAKMKKLLENAELNYDSYSSDDGIDWDGTVAGKCEIVDVKLKLRTPHIDFSDFKCNDCQKHDTPICFVCRKAVSKTDKKMRQKCVFAHCHKYYHLECLDHWPQTQFNSGESRNNKKVNEYFETLTCPRHVCHTCVSDDPRGCKTRFSADKLAKCVRCPATYHSFNKCLPAGTQVLTASQIICPRHVSYAHKTGKVSYHVNTGWCFICAEGGSLICCEYCPTSFHAECLNIKPPEGNYMCEDCETGRLPLYGEMVWVKLGHYRWWPGIILHPSEIPENLFLMKHGIGDFVVRFFGQYDHYWVNRGRVFPYQEGDSGRISSQKSKIDAAFTTAIEHAQRAYEILKNTDTTNDEESQDIASSLLPPHYVKLKCNKPSGSLCGRRMEDPSLSLTACECSPTEPDPCGPYSHCLNRMLLTECGPTCRTGDRCNNRAFEKRLYPKMVPYRTPHRGWGLKTLEAIKAGQFVIEYVGELIDEEEFRRRMRRKHEIRDENYYFLELDKERMIDAGPKGNLARFMNHCCEPNCETQKWTVLGDVRVGLFAIDDIPANTEVTFNYKLECDGIEKKRCLCGAKRCSGYIGAKLKQDESQSKKGKNGKIKRSYNKKKKIEDSPSTSKSKPKRPLGRPPKPKELTEIEKDLLIINNASKSDESKTLEEKNIKTEENQQKSLKRKRSISVEVSNQEPIIKKVKSESEKPLEVGD